MKEIKDIWFKTELDLDVLAKKLDFDIEEFDYENVWEWVIASVEGVKIDICRDHTEKPSQTFTDIFRIDGNKEAFQEKTLNLIISKLKILGITPIYLGTLWIGKNETFEYKIAKTIK